MSEDHIDAASMRPWRSQATVKLVGRRREALMRIASRESPGCSPVEAIDRAIDLAGRDGDASAESRLDAIEAKLDVIEDTLQAMDWQRRAEAAKSEAALSSIAKSLAGLHALIAAAAADGDQSF